MQRFELRGALAFDDCARARIRRERLDIDVRVTGTWGEVGDVARVPDLHGDRLEGKRRQTRSGECEGLAFANGREVPTPQITVPLRGQSFGVPAVRALQRVTERRSLPQCFVHEGYPPGAKLRQIGRAHV